MTTTNNDMFERALAELSTLKAAADSLPDSNQTTFWRFLLDEIIKTAGLCSISNLESLSFSMVDTEEFDTIPEGSIWVEASAWTKTEDLHLWDAVNNAAQKTGYRLDDHTRDGESYTFLVVPGKA